MMCLHVGSPVLHCLTVRAPSVGLVCSCVPARALKHLPGVGPPYAAEPLEGQSESGELSGALAAIGELIGITCAGQQ